MIKLSFKAVHQVLYHHVALFQEIQQVLPTKANKADVHQQLSQKANLLDMKKTMAEVAANIESRVSFDDAKRLLEDKVTRVDFHYQLQNKPSFDDIKAIMEQMSVSPQQEMFEDELTKMRARIEELYKEVSRKAAATSANGDFSIVRLIHRSEIR